MDINNNQTGNSKERREQLKREIDLLGKNLPFKFEKNSQLRIMKAICTYIKKDKHFSRINQLSSTDQFICANEANIDQLSSGFMTCFTNKGDLVYISENISDFFGINALDVLFAYDNILEIPCKRDTAVFSQLFTNYQNYTLPNRISFYSSWFVSRIQKKNIYLNEYKQFKMTGHYDPTIELFVFKCEPVLSTNNRDVLTATNAKCFKTTHKLNLQILDYSSMFYQFLGYNSTDFQEIFNLYRLLSADCLETVIKRHKDLLYVKNTRGYTDRVKLIHRNGGYIDCLLNMHYDPKGFIVCVYQMFTNEDIEKYISYMDSFNSEKNADIEEIVENNKVDNNSDESEFSQSSPVVKHKFDEETISAKKIKREFDFDFNEALSIYNIEEALKREVCSPPKCEYTNPYPFGYCSQNEVHFGQTECLNGHSQSQIEDNLDNFDFENQFLQDCDLENFKYEYGLSNDYFLADDKLNLNNQCLINTNGNFLDTFYDRQFF